MLPACATPAVAAHDAVTDIVTRYVSEPHRVRYYTEKIPPLAHEFHVPPAYLARLIGIESEYHPREISSAGALGLMQVMPFHFRDGENWRDPETNMRVGLRVLMDYKRRFRTWHPALVAYNMGPGNGPHRGIYRSRYSELVVRGRLSQGSTR